jgi:hypothetical protein
VEVAVVEELQRAYARVQPWLDGACALRRGRCHPIKFNPFTNRSLLLAKRRRRSKGGEVLPAIVQPPPPHPPLPTPHPPPPPPPLPIPASIGGWERRGARHSLVVDSPVVVAWHPSKQRNAVRSGSRNNRAAWSLRWCSRWDLASTSHFRRRKKNARFDRREE